MDETIISWNSGARTRFITGDSVEVLKDLLENRKAVLVADETVASLHPQRMPASLPTLQLVADEKEKTLDTVRRIYDFLMCQNADRSTVLVAAGGGIVTDAAAFAASTYMRGMELILVPTSLLGQVDAAIGGKTAVNFAGCKNLIGSFYQPELVLIDRNFLLTLPEKEIQNGMAETIKHAAIRDRELWDLLKVDSGYPHRETPIPNPGILERSLQIKLDIVREDEKESGSRKLLNFGHTFGHIIEAEFRVAHGHAVSIGMVIAAEISTQLGYADQGIVAEITNMLERWGLPTSIPAELDSCLNKLLFDKKKAGESITLVLLEEISRPVLSKVSIENVCEAVHDLR